MRHMAESRECKICGISEAEVVAVRNRDGYTLGCGIESNTESGSDFEELSPKHRWVPWRDLELDLMGIKPEAFARYRESILFGIQYAACDDTKRGHRYVEEPDALHLIPVGTCLGCGHSRAPLQQPGRPSSGPGREQTPA